MGLGCALSAARCRPQSEANAQSQPRDTGVLVARPDATLTLDASSAQPRPTALPYGWRAVDGGYARQVTRYGELVTTRYEERNRDRYIYRRQPQQRTVDEFSAVLPPGDPGRFPFGMSGHGCEPTILCEHGAGAAPPSPSGSGPRCAPTSTRQPSYEVGTSGRGALLADLTRQERREHRGDVCCYEWRRMCGGGRLLVRDGDVVLAKTKAFENNPTNSRLARELSPRLSKLSAAERRALAERWAREASFEHASVWSFDLALLELESLGAPRSIVARTRRARSDERRHARALYELASVIAGTALGPSDEAIEHGAPRSIVDFASALFIEACVNETVAIAHAQEALSDPRLAAPVAAILRAIVEDELRHMELAWRTLAWCVREGGEPVRVALERALASLIESMDRPREAPTSDEAPRELLAAWGCLSSDARSRVERACVLGVIVPCVRALLAV